MKFAIIGSRNLIIKDFNPYLPKEVTEIVSGGAQGIDTCAEKYAKANSIKFTEFLPEYEKYGRAAPILRNQQIIDYADAVLVFWDGESRGTKNVIDSCKKKNKRIIILKINKQESGP